MSFCNQTVCDNTMSDLDNPDSFCDIPNLLYVGDVPVESSQHGSALLYRLFEGYPPNKLLVLESDLASSQSARRLPKVSYRVLPTGCRRLLDSRFHGLYSGWLSWTASARAARLRALLAGFAPNAIISVGHGYGWLTAAALAERLRIPFHLIVHDDWPRLGGILPRWRSWLEQRFGAVYCRATSRLCVSPFMAEEYERRYGVPGSVLYPSRSSDCPVFEAATARALAEEDELVIGYGGNGCPEVVLCLVDLVRVLATAKARLLVFGPFNESVQRELLAISPAITFRGMVPYRQMITELHATTDLLFVPMAFGEASRDNMIVSFPSKLADYTATGRPLLIYGPPYCSAVRWARIYSGVADIVDQNGPARLLGSLQRLRQDPDHRRVLAERAVAVGAQCFSASSARERLYAALMGGVRQQRRTHLQRSAA